MDIITKEKLVKKLRSDGHVIISDSLMKRYFGLSWREYKKLNKMDPYDIT